MRALITFILSVLLCLSLFSVIVQNAAPSSAISPKVVDTAWEKTRNLRKDDSPCLSLAPTDPYWKWTTKVWDGAPTWVLGTEIESIPDYVPGYWASIPCLEGCNIPFPATHQWFRTILNLPSLTDITKIELIGLYKQQYGGIIPVNDNIFVFANPSAFTLNDIVAYGGTASQDWIGFPSDLTARLPPPPIYCDFIEHGAVDKAPCQVTHYVAPETTWYIDPLELPIDAFHQGNNVVYILLEEFCEGGGLAHLAFRINSPQNFVFSSSGPVGVTKGLIETYTTNYKITANVDLTNVKVQGGIGSKAKNINIYFDDVLVGQFGSLISWQWTSGDITLKLGTSKQNNVFTLMIPSMVEGESHKLSIIFDWTFDSTGTQQITGAWSAVCTSIFGTLNTPYTGVITITVA